ncbi:hypothetical protein [Alicyclobacillus dauci]|uniref:hypothetical protein n=1 Tax=Alicyclobacillus dauci TaxID=1475485 RepID=UPI003898EEC4
MVAVDTIGSRKEHLRITVVGDKSRSHTLLAFGRGGDVNAWQVGTVHRLLVTIQENIWNTQRKLQLLLVDHRIL